MSKIMALCGAPAVAMAILATPAVSAEDLSDFQRAVGGRGCDSIPYASLRSNCNDYQQRVDATRYLCFK